MSDSRDLAAIQRWMHTVITHHDGVAGGVLSEAAREQIDVSLESVDAVIDRSQSLTSIERLAVYGNAYFARLLDCLRDEYPALVQALGADTFDGFAFGYLGWRPPHSYTLADLGADFPKYLGETRPGRESNELDWAQFFVDLATLERDYAELFDGEGPENAQLLTAEEISAVDADRWPTARLRLAPWLRFRVFSFPVHEYASAVRVEGATPPPPAATPTWLVLTRRDYVVRRTPVSEPQFELLRSLRDGQTVADAIATAAAIAQPDDVAAFGADIRRWFFDWSAAGFFHSVDIE
ncbi:MAG: DNA-binding domain-containing protein [Pirellulaceae bacterium]|jgi:hypothetical protein|nr:DNA-binding domain-containing protein [Pirellulaceae bacterium]MDP7016407.1 DNA-binding domain-containing protein [Pirellulaceae bacterium]